MSERENMDLTPGQEQELQASLRALGEVRADDAFRARLREQFVSGAIAEEAIAEGAVDGGDGAARKSAPVAGVVPLRARRRWPAPLAAVVAAAAVLAFVLLSGGDPLWQLREVRGAGALTVAGVEVGTGSGDRIAELLTPGAPVVVGEGVEVDLVLGDVLVIGMAGPGEFSLVAQAPRRHEIEVAEGEFRFKSGPGFTGHRMLMHTSEGTVEITGTTVAVFKNAEVTCVCVLAGTASVGRDGAHMADIPAGMRKVMFADGREPMIIPIEPGHRQGLVDFVGHNEHTFD